MMSATGSVRNSIAFARTSFHADDRREKIDAYKLTKLGRKFWPQIADSDEQKRIAFNMRYRVFVEELALEPENDFRIERNGFDDYSNHCIMRTKTDDTPCGTVRLVTPSSHDELLPIEAFCSHSITQQAFHPSNFPREDICEISRLAIPSHIRRNSTSDEIERAKCDKRTFRFISVMLYLTASAMAVKAGKKHAYVMIEPRLARRVSALGLKLKQIGSAVDYHGERAPYYISADMFFSDLKLSFRKIYDQIATQI